MSTYIPRQIKPIRERVDVKLDRELIVELEQYCEYLASDRDYVITQALKVAFMKDKDFREWRKNRPVPQPTNDPTVGKISLKTRSQQ